ncbi:hypothetical protein [Tardiphaga sp.]|uniref:hypothetical protein n=1 Tax=Tardiphaga sp. TaxID=1926292 RepID=UPI0025D5A119|nr:hypothetical protein [Tardiphaga sp.]
MKNIVVLAALVTALISAPAFAGGGGGRGGLAINANVLVGAGGVHGLLNGGGRGYGVVAVNANVTTGKGGVLGAILGGGRGGNGGHSGSGCGC